MAKAVPTDTRERVAKLLPTLSSNQAGEVAATAAAIGRALKAVGCDWHDLAKVLTERPTVSQRASDAMHERTPPNGGFGGFGGFAGFEDFMPPRRPAAPRRPFEGEASRSQAEHRQRKTPVKGAVMARELRGVVDDMESAVGGDLDGLNDERAFTFLSQLRDKCAKYDIVRISSKQDRWIRSLARTNGVNVPWTEIED